MYGHRFGKMSDEYSWNLERDEQTQHLLTRWDVRMAKHLLVNVPRHVELLCLQRYRDAFQIILEDAVLKHDADWDKVDPRLPVIFGTDGDGKKFILDGIHRLMKAVDTRVDWLPTVTLTEAETEQVRFR